MNEIVNFTVILTNGYVNVKMPLMKALLLMETWEGYVGTDSVPPVLPLFAYDPDGREQCKAAVIATKSVIAMYTTPVDESRVELIKKQNQLLSELVSSDIIQSEGK